jgi:hypothetical protein
LCLLLWVLCWNSRRRSIAGERCGEGREGTGRESWSKTSGAWESRQSAIQASIASEPSSGRSITYLQRFLPNVMPL